MNKKITVPAIAGVISAIAAACCNSMAQHNNMMSHIHEASLFYLYAMILAVIAVACIIVAGFFAYRQRKNE